MDGWLARFNEEKVARRDGICLGFVLRHPTTDNWALARRLFKKSSNAALLYQVDNKLYCAQAGGPFRDEKGASTNWNGGSRVQLICSVYREPTEMLQCRKSITTPARFS